MLTLDRGEKAGEIEKPFFYDPGVELLRELGLTHEHMYLRHLAEIQGLQVVHIPTDVPWADAVSRTVEAIGEGAGAVYQATFQDGVWRGRADFLIRVDRRSALGAFAYEVVETKLARSCQGARHTAALFLLRAPCEDPRCPIGVDVCGAGRQ
jgi:hypothetical protein